MKINAYDANNNPIELEVYKVQLSLFGLPGVLIYNEDRTETYQTHNENEINVISKFVKNKYKSFAAGTYDKKTGKIILMHALPDENLF